MTVKELMEALKDVDPDERVLLSSDSEGNHISPLASLGSGYYKPNDDKRCWDVEMYSEELEDTKPCICLWPLR